MIAEPLLPTIDLTLKAPIDPLQYRPMLEKLQGNILKSHGHDHVRLLLLRFSATVPGVRGWVRSFAANWITSAQEQLEERKACPQRQERGVFGSLLLTAWGYETLGYPLDEVKTRFKEQDPGPAVKFTAGMAGARAVLNDPDCSTWEKPYKFCREQPIHAMAVLAASSGPMLEWASGKVERSLEGVCEIVGLETGAVLRDQKNRSVEPFGFADGISQPLFFQDDVDRAKRGGGTSAWDPAAPLSLALIADPFTDDPDCFGSFLVFRKLEQNVKGFRERLRDVARVFTGGDEELAGAFVVGRFRNGVPVIAHRNAVDADSNFNNFNYFQDPNGARCPVHAHTRKTNQRGVGSGPAVKEERMHRIVRRGVPYDSRPVREGEAEEGVGLLFLCFQADIGNQFAFIQERWANKPDFPVGAAGVDPLIGKAPAGQVPDQQWQAGWDAVSKSPDHVSFGQFVTLKGGEFFFAPSIPFLRRLITPGGT